MTDNLDLGGQAIGLKKPSHMGVMNKFTRLK